MAGIFQTGFYIETEYDFDTEKTEAEDETNVQEHLEPTAISFWDFKIFNADEEEISINDRETKGIKQLVENKLIDLLTEELND
jgi:hypothetical protein